MNDFRMVCFHNAMMFDIAAFGCLKINNHKEIQESNRDGFHAHWTARKEGAYGQAL